MHNGCHVCITYHYIIVYIFFICCLIIKKVKSSEVEYDLKLNLDNTLIKTLGIEIKEITENGVVATMPVDERTHQPFGVLHGGASVALAETAASIGAYYFIDQENEICVGLEINANHIKAKREGTVTAYAKPAHRGRSSMVWEIRIVDEQEELICLSRCTMAVIPKKSK